jgi:undecaprenyl-diphosphatase
MEQNKKFPWVHQIICLAPLAVTLTVIVVFIGTDEAATRAFSHINSEEPELTVAIKEISRWIPNLFYIAWCIILIHALITKNKSTLCLTLLFFFAQVCFSFFLVRIIKICAGLPRPYAVLEGAVAVPFSFTNTEQHSFPSGHTATVALSTSCTASIFSKYSISLFMGVLLAVLGFSRIYLLMHHMSDIVMGTCIGLAGNIFIHRMYKR